jgi:hypothetical protein
MGFGALALVAPQAGEAGGSRELKRFRPLPFRDRERLMIAQLGGNFISGGVQQLASQPVQLGLVIALVNRLDKLRGLGKAVQALFQLTNLGIGLGEPYERKRRGYDRAGRTKQRETPCQEGEAFLRFSERSQRPTMPD